MDKIKDIENLKERSMTELEAMRSVLLRQLGRVGPLIDGSTMVAQHSCGNKEGKKTPQMRVQRSVNGKLHAVHVPRDLEPTVESWNAEYQRVQKLLHQIGELSELMIRRYVKEKRQRPKNPKLKFVGIEAQ